MMGMAKMVKRVVEHKIFWLVGISATLISGHLLDVKTNNWPIVVKLFTVVIYKCW